MKGPRRIVEGRVHCPIFKLGPAANGHCEDDRVVHTAHVDLDLAIANIREACKSATVPIVVVIWIWSAISWILRPDPASVVISITAGFRIRIGVSTDRVKGGQQDDRQNSP